MTSTKVYKFYKLYEMGESIITATIEADSDEEAYEIAEWFEVEYDAVQRNGEWI